MRGFVGMNDGAARNAVPNHLGTIGLTLHDEGKDAARTLRHRFSRGGPTPIPLHRHAA